VAKQKLNLFELASGSVAETAATAATIVGYLLVTGTVSVREERSQGCLLEKRHNPEPIPLTSGELHTFLEDGGCVTMRGYCQKEGSPRIGFGECAGMVAGAAQ
jgi:fumarylacetoacetase